VSKRIRYIAELAHVHEVSLLGTADFAFWQSRLRAEELAPVDRNGEAQILIVAATMRYMAVRFTEVSFSVLLSGVKDAPEEGGAFLVQAFNSFRPFAFIERALFATPYQHAECRLSVVAPISVEIVQRGESLFRAVMSQSVNATARPRLNDNNGWEGPVFLPRNKRRGTKGRMFFARVRGRGSTYPFTRAGDTLLLASSPAPEVFQLLRDSRFAPTQWLVREDATHGKSKTYQRS
jgi:hypothetical protein